jgi:hypothetical protein
LRLNFGSSLFFVPLIWFYPAGLNPSPSEGAKATCLSA